VLHNPPQERAVGQGTYGTSEICVYCHTPHHGSSNAPLWNKGNQSTTYTAYGTTLAGTVVSNIGASSLACLSCHDGVNTFDTLVNAPGKGNFGDPITGVAKDFDWNFAMPRAAGDGAYGPTITNDHFDSGILCSFCHDVTAFGFYAGGGIGSPSDRLSLGTDMTNDHPVSIVYDDALDSLRATSTVITSIDMSIAPALTVNDESNSTTTISNRWAVNGMIDGGQATIADLLRGGRVECVSCHDPHFDNRSWDEGEPGWGPPGASMLAPYWCSDAEDCSDGNFLRRVGGNSVSGVCRTCHTN
jgi:hypothetical protein